MWDMFSNSLRLFLKGRLFREPATVLRQWLIGCGVSFGTVVLFVKLGMPLGVSVVIVALAAGGLQPFLFKNLKYA